MRPIHDPGALTPGATLYHSAFGFAQVEAVDDDAVTLTWEREGGHLPSRVRFPNLQRVYSQCAADGFFHAARHDPTALKRTLLDRPADALVSLLDDLAQPQRVRDVMDWLVGRDLFTAKTFVRWWGTAKPTLEADGRVAVDGDWLRLAGAPADDADALVQLAPKEVEAEPDADELGEDTDAGVDALPRPAPFATPRAITLGEAQPPAVTLPEIGLAVATALADAHAAGRAVGPRGDTTVFHPDGRVTFEVVGAGAPADDVRAAAIVLVEALTGRAVPPGTDPADLLPHLRHRLPDLAPSALAPLASALRPAPSARPTAAAWAAQWAGVAEAEAGRAAAHDPQATLRLAYESHVGRAKLLATQTNQDAVWVGTRGAWTVAALADGISISDAGRGDQASWLAVQAIKRMWQSMPAPTASCRRMLDRALHRANRSICEHALRAAGGDLAGRLPMGSTITVLAAIGNRVHLAWLGDSRAYVVGPYGIGQLTADDNVSGERYLAWCQGEARTWSADGHALVRYLGHFDEGTAPAPFAAHHQSFVLRPDERLVLCSDGVTDYLDTHEAEVAHRLHRLATADDPWEVAAALVAAANRTGGGDNASAVVVDVG